MLTRGWAGAQVGVLDDVLTNVHNVVRKGRLGPGQMISADLVEGVFKENVQIAREVATEHPYREWLSTSHRLAELAPRGGFLEEPQMGAAEVRASVATHPTFSGLRPCVVLWVRSRSALDAVSCSALHDDMSRGCKVNLC